MRRLRLDRIDHRYILPILHLRDKLSTLVLRLRWIWIPLTLRRRSRSRARGLRLRLRLGLRLALVPKVRISLRDDVSLLSVHVHPIHPLPIHPVRPSAGHPLPVHPSPIPTSRLRMRRRRRRQLTPLATSLATIPTRRPPRPLIPAPRHSGRSRRRTETVPRDGPSTIRVHDRYAPSRARNGGSSGRGGRGGLRLGLDV